MHLSLVVFQAAAFLLVQASHLDLFPRISGGQNAVPHEFPFIVKLTSTYSSGYAYSCGGSIISATRILTAAHCTESTDDHGGSLRSMTVTAGAHTLSSPNQNVQTRNVVGLSQHSSWDSAAIREDVAILELDRPLTLNQYVKTICLASGSSSYAGSLVTIMGWGKTDAGSSADTLQKVSVQVLGTDKCRHDATKTICTADPTGGHKSTCGGDSGGPLVVSEGGRYKQIGLVSFGRGGCGANGKQTVYTRVTAYRNWIQQASGANLSC